MNKVATKALYLLLCSILGMVLFAMLHRALFVLYDLVLIYNFDTYSFGMSEATILAFDFFSMIVALFLGGWYGIALGLDWHSRVYGVDGTNNKTIFHGFVPHNWRKNQDGESTKKVAGKFAPATAPAPARPSAAPTTATWNFEDFLNATPEPKKIVKPTAGVKTISTKKPVTKKAVKKVVRKTPAKRVVAKVTTIE